ncbi:MAG: glutathione S-transferase family protein [Pseudomonadota bacterium]
MDIYGDTQSGNCMKVKYTADHLELSYTWHSLDILDGSTRTPEFLQVNPHGQVPVIVLEDGRVLAQSNAIIAYLAEDTELLPSDRFARAQVLQWLFWEQYSHEPYIAVCRFHMHYLGKSKETREAWRVERGEAALDALEHHLSQWRWLVSDQFTIADIALFAYTHLAHEGGFDLTPRPSARRWIAECGEVLAVAPSVGD